MIETFHPRIKNAHDTLKKLERNPAPTVPFYGINVSVGPTPSLCILVAATKKIAINVDTEYLVEIMIDPSSTRDIYLNGVLINSAGIGTGIAAGIVDIGWQGNSDFVAVAGQIARFRNMNVGTTRHGTDLFSDSLSTLPGNPPYITNDVASVSMGSFGGNNVLEVQRTAVFNTGVQLRGQASGATPGSPKFIAGLPQPPIWFEVLVSFPPSTSTAIQTAFGPTFSGPGPFSGWEFLDVEQNAGGDFSPNCQITLDYDVPNFP